MTPQKKKPARPGPEGLSGTIRDDGGYRERDRNRDRDNSRGTGGAVVDDDNDFPLDEGDEQNFFA